MDNQKEHDELKEDLKKLEAAIKKLVAKVEKLK